MIANSLQSVEAEAVVEDSVVAVEEAAVMAVAEGVEDMVVVVRAGEYYQHVNFQYT